jgi:hypothetical protein
MPTVLRLSGFRFFFYSLENSEPAHIHVEHGDRVAKFWLNPVILAESHGFRPHEVQRMRALVIEHRVTFMEAWNVHFRRQT